MLQKDTSSEASLGPNLFAFSAIYVAGDALWLGPNAADGQVNAGEMIGLGELKSGRAVFDLEGCTAPMALKDAGVKVEEESGCGGMNVSFAGEYNRK